MSTIPGLFVAGEANFSDHGANRLGASALMQGLADGYFVVPFSVGNYLANEKVAPVSTDDADFKRTEDEVTAHLQKMLDVGKKGNRTVIEIYRDLGEIMYDQVGMSRTPEGLKEAIT